MKNPIQNRALRKFKCPALAGALIACITIHAQATLLLHMEFNNPNTATTTAVSSVGGYVFDLRNSAGTATALQTGTGVSGNAGDYSLNTTSATGMGSGNTGPYAQYNNAGANPDFTEGTMESFTLAGWYQTAGAIRVGGSGSTRLFSTNRLTITAFPASTPFNSRMQVDFAATGGLSATTASSYEGWNLTEEWVFFAFTYDSTVSVGNNASWYRGTIGDSVTSAGNFNLAELPWNGFSNTQPYRIGNVRDNNNNPFDGYLDDIRIYAATTGSSGALSMAQLEAIRVVAIPEPTSLAALLFALAVFALWRPRSARVQ